MQCVGAGVGLPAGVMTTVHMFLSNNMNRPPSRAYAFSFSAIVLGIAVVTVAWHRVRAPNHVPDLLRLVIRSLVVVCVGTLGLGLVTGDKWVGVAALMTPIFAFPTVVPAVWLARLNMVSE